MPLQQLERLKAVNRFLTLEIDRKKELDDIVKVAAEFCQTSVGLITLLDDQTQYVKFQVGFNHPTTSKKDAFCQYTIQEYAVLEVPDAKCDERFVHNPLVTGDPNIRFYAGAPLTTQDGHNIGSLCVIDQQPKELTDSQKQLLQVLARQIIQVLEFEFSINALKSQFVKAKQGEIKLRSFFESSVSCHLLLGRDFDVLAFNQSLELFIDQLYGVKIGEGMDIRAYLHESHLPTFVENYRVALSGKAVTSEQEVIYPDKRVFWYITYEPARNEEGDILGVSCNATDITERIHREQLLGAQNESLRKIAYIHSHELRRPVSSILGLMDLIKGEDYFHPDREELVMLERAVKELDEKISTIVSCTTER